MREKATKKTFCDKGQNSCYDVDFSGHSCHKLIYYFSNIIFLTKKWLNIYLGVLALSNDIVCQIRLNLFLQYSEVNLGIPQR